MIKILSEILKGEFKVLDELTLVLDTSHPKARLGLFASSKLVDSIEWEAGRELSKTFFTYLEKLFKNNNRKSEELCRIIVVKGPGSFTGLRIGVAIANTFSYALSIPIIGVVTKRNLGLDEIFCKAKNITEEKQIVPFYDREPNITKRKDSKRSD